MTARGAKHLRELAAVAAAGQRAVMLYVVQRTDCASFRLAEDLDPAYAAAFATARAAGVEVLAHATRIDREGVRLRPLAARCGDAGIAGGHICPQDDLRQRRAVPYMIARPEPEARGGGAGDRAAPPFSRVSHAASSITTCRIAPAPIPKQSAAQ